MTLRYGRGSSRSRKPAEVRSRAEWRGLAALARRCAADAVDEVNDTDAQLRLMALGRQSASATATVLERDAGATVADVARAFNKMIVAFARPATGPALRQALAPLIEASGAFLDDQLHVLNTDDFNRAHAGRPEVCG